ncbi:MAG: hypothetical protein ACLFS7_06850 [Desulfosudaceae bacterium]
MESVFYPGGHAKAGKQQVVIRGDDALGHGLAGEQGFRVDAHTAGDLCSIQVQGLGKGQAFLDGLFGFSLAVWRSPVLSRNDRPEAQPHVQLHGLYQNHKSGHEAAGQAGQCGNSENRMALPKYPPSFSLIFAPESHYIVPAFQQLSFNKDRKGHT